MMLKQGDKCKTDKYINSKLVQRMNNTITCEHRWFHSAYYRTLGRETRSRRSRQSADNM